MATTTRDIWVWFNDPMPVGYRFIPKRDADMSIACRMRAGERYQMVYFVQDLLGKPLGIRVPTKIFDEVHAEYLESARYDDVLKDLETATGLEETLECFYQTPPYILRTAPATWYIKGCGQEASPDID